MDLATYKQICGMRFTKFFDEDIVRSAIDYKPRSDDVFISSYPKSGTTWTQFVVLSILNKGNPPSTFADFMLASPYLEFTGAESAERMARPGPIKSHLPFHVKQPSIHAKYIYVARNPYDVCVSYYYHTRALTPKSEKDVSFAKFHDMFITGKLSYCEYFDHVIPWYERREDPNVFFFTYESMRQDPYLWALKIADFLGVEYGNQLRADPCALRSVIDSSSMARMKEVLNERLPMMMEEVVSLPQEKALECAEAYRGKLEFMKDTHKYEGFVRKGEVGGWKACFTPELISKTEAWIARRTQGSDVMKLWIENTPS
ncbi:sulfotransferase 1E1-like [Haemaphysalis longicornis]